MGRKHFENPDESQFHTSQEGEYGEPNTEKKKKSKRARTRKRLKVLTWILSVILFIECAYCVCIFTDLPVIKDLRNIWISTAMATMNHRWLATALIPGDIVQPIIDEMEAERINQVDIESSWEEYTKPPTEATTPTHATEPTSGSSLGSLLSGLLGNEETTGTDQELDAEAEAFFQLFHELDRDSVLRWVETHPECIENGWESFYVNEAGLEDQGTDIYTNAGDQVLAINGEHGLLAIRVQDGIQYRGVLVIGKDPSRVKLAPSAYFGAVGQHVGEMVEKHEALVGMTASGFGESEDVGEGGDMTGAAMHSGKTAGYHYPWGYKRVELHLDNRLYITDSYKSFSKECTDASEWTPALIVDGKIVVSARDNYTEMNPRACLGQTRDEAMMFLVIEGRRVGISIGTDTMVCADILARYDCYQAMNVDGGTSAIMYYENEYITLCSNPKCPEGRRLPNAWLYCKETVPDP